MRVSYCLPIAFNLNVMDTATRIAYRRVSKLGHNTREKKSLLASFVVASYMPTVLKARAFYFLTAAPKSLVLSAGESMT